MDTTQLLQTVMATLSAVLIPTLIIVVLEIVAQWKIFTKAGEAGWKSIIPIYNSYTLFNIFWDGKIFLYYILGYIIVGILSNVASNLATILSLVIAIAAIVLAIMVNIKKAKCFGKSGAFAVGLIFLPIIFDCILAFGSAEYHKED